MDVKDAELMPKIYAWMSQAEAYQAWEVMYELSRDEPEEAWMLILDAIALAPSRLALGSIAAGPLEDLLHGYGPQFIDRAVAASAARSRPMRRATRWCAVGSTVAARTGTSGQPGRR